jgi:hypothetical protein
LFGLALPAALLVPPYQGLDEARHPLAYARLVRATGPALERFVALGQAGHVETIRWRPDLRVTAATAAAPEPFFVNRNILLPGSIETFIPDYRARAPLVARLWLLTAPLFEGRSAGATLLGLRWLNVAVAAALAGLGAAVLAGCLPAGGGRWAAAGPLLLFVLPTYLGGLSNYAVLVGAAALVAGCVAALAVRFETWWPTAAALGLGLGLAWHGSVNAAVLLVAAGLWLLHRPVVRWTEVRAGRLAPEGGRVWGWWFALAAGFGVTRIFGTPEFDAELRRLAGAGSWSAVAAWPGSLLLAGCLGMAALESLAERPARRGGRRPAGAAGSAGPAWAGLPAGLLAAAVALTAVVFTFVRPPNLEDREQPWRQYPGLPSSGAPLLTVRELAEPVTSLPRGGQVREVLRVLAANLTPRPADFILVRAFWTGVLNGDVRVPRWVEVAGAGLFLGGLLTGLSAVARGRRPAAAWMLLLGVAAFLAALAFATAMYWPRNLYARYAAPLLLVLFCTAMLGWRGPLDRLAARWPWLAAGLVTGLLLLLHGAWVAAVTARFFG